MWNRNGTTGRRQFLRSVLAAATGGLAGCAFGEGDAARTSTRSSTPTSTPSPTPSPTPSGPRVGLETVAELSGTPVALAIPDDEHLYAAERRGVVHVLGPDGLREEPLLDVREQVVTGGERGLLGLALHPDFSDDRRLFVRYSAPPRPGTPDGYSHTGVLAEFRVTEDGRRVAPGSERTVLELDQPHQNHNAGDVAFGPDGYCYVPVGDGGGGGGGDSGPGHAADWYAALEGGNGQNVSANLLGSVLRIDVDSRYGDLPYGIPDDNPLVGQAGLNEQYAWGFRNPWRLSFDGDRLFVCDVGAGRYEEVNLVEKGGNYGWNVREGTHCYGAQEYGIEACPGRAPDHVRGGERLRDPVVEYPHPPVAPEGAEVTGFAVVCGVFYRQSAVPAFEGRLVFSDWQARGRLFTARPVEDGLWSTEAVPVVEAARDAVKLVYAFAQGPAGDVYLTAMGYDGNGFVHRVVAPG